MPPAKLMSRLLSRPLCASCKASILQRSPVQITRTITSTTPHRAQDEPTREEAQETLLSSFENYTEPPAPAPVRRRPGTPARGQQANPNATPTSDNKNLNDMLGLFDKSQKDPLGHSANYTEQENLMRDMHHFHVYATKHNTHITLTDPQRRPLLSLSAGNLGFKKANRGTYDAAYQLASYVLGRMREQGMMTKIQAIEVILRGFGVGREAVSKSLMGVEGQGVRSAIRRISDNTRLKFGGTRSRKIRRLG